jgi:hypothetical protein
MASIWAIWTVFFFLISRSAWPPWLPHHWVVFHILAVDLGDQIAFLLRLRIGQIGQASTAGIEPAE